MSGPVTGGIGERPLRSDGPRKVTGSFPYSSDLRVDGMLHGATHRSPHAHARIHWLDTSRAAAVPGVLAVMTHADLPGAATVGQIVADEPVLAADRVRRHGEAIALVAADHPETARRAAALVEVGYEPLPVIDSVDAALAPGAAPLHEGGNVTRALEVLHGDPEAEGEVVVRGTYVVGRQDQAFLGPESGLAVPTGDGGIELHIATQWLHVDRDQVAAGLGLAPEKVTFVLAGVGGAFGGREDLSVQLHACMLALRTERPVRMAYTRDESFVGHVHRHPARMTYEHHADRDGTLVCVRARLEFDGGAYASTSPAVIANATTLAAGPYFVPNARLEGIVAYTNNPPSGAMRGFGAPQVAIAVEGQMDRLAAALDMDPLSLRQRNALQTGQAMPTGQLLRGPAPIPQLLDELRALPMPAPLRDDPRAVPGGPFGAGDGEGLVRAVGYAAGFKNIAFSEGVDDSTTARVRLAAQDGRVFAEVHTAAAEVGQGVIGIQEQILRTELGVDDVRVLVADTRIASAGSASASRLTWMVGGAVLEACRAVQEAVFERTGVPPAELAEEALARALAEGPIEAERIYRHRPTAELDARGQGDAHAGFGFVAHRAVVDLDVELGLARVVELACAQDVGRAMNPLALEGQIEGGSVQGVGLALTEDLLSVGGIVRNRSFGSYRIPTIVDAPPVTSIILELSDPDTPYGLKGVGEMPSISSTPAIVAALRAATGRPLDRVPVLPEDLATMQPHEEPTA